MMRIAPWKSASARKQQLHQHKRKDLPHPASPLFIPRKKSGLLFSEQAARYLRNRQITRGGQLQPVPCQRRCRSYLTKFFSKRDAEILRLVLPFGSVGVGVARVEDLGVHARQFGRNLKVEVRNLLGGRLQDVAGQNRVDDAAGILDGDALASAVPAGVDEVRLRAVRLPSS